VNAATCFGDTTFLTKNSDEHQAAANDLAAGSRFFPERQYLGGYRFNPVSVSQLQGPFSLGVSHSSNTHHWSQPLGMKCCEH